MHPFWSKAVRMGKKRKLTAREKAEKKRRQREFMTIFINGKQKRVRRPPTIDGIPVDEFIRQNADPIWLLQNEEWELLEEWNQAQQTSPGRDAAPPTPTTDDDIPF
jgi:hypothetical protein